MTLTASEPRLRGFDKVRTIVEPGSFVAEHQIKLTGVFAVVADDFIL